MPDIDQALARAFAARRAPSEPPAAGSTPPPPHFAVGPAIPADFEWPETVLALEAEHGDRFDGLADAMIEARDRRQCRVVLFTSCHRAEGRSTLVMALGRALGRRHGRTVLVDNDLSGPMLGRLLRERPRVGLDDVVTEGLALGEALVDSPGENLALLPLRAPVARPREFLADEGWALVLARLRREFDMVLLDGGPLFPGLSAGRLVPSADAAVLVYRPGLTGERALRRAREVLAAGGVPLLGLAETFA